MAVATYTDVAVPLGRAITDTTEQAQVTWWLNGVERLIVSRLGPIVDLDTDAVVYVEAEAVAAKVRRNGTAESSITVAVDDGSVTRRYENTTVSPGDVTDEWWALLQGQPTGRSAHQGWLL